MAAGQWWLYRRAGLVICVFNFDHSVLLVALMTPLDVVLFVPRRANFNGGMSYTEYHAHVTRAVSGMQG
jgi:hypothetical protein